MGGQSALSPGYNDNEVLKKLADNVGVKLNYETMSDSLSEQVNIRIAGDQLPDAFMGVASPTTISPTMVQTAPSWT